MPQGRPHHVTRGQVSLQGARCDHNSSAEPLWLQSLGTCHCSLTPDFCSSEGSTHPERAGCIPGAGIVGEMDPTGIYSSPGAELPLSRDSVPPPEHVQAGLCHQTEQPHAGPTQGSADTALRSVRCWLQAEKKLGMMGI